MKLARKRIFLISYVVFTPITNNTKSHGGTLGFSVLAIFLIGFSVFVPEFLAQKTFSVFRFWCSLRFADFSVFSIRFSVFVENNSGFLVLLFNVVCIRFSVWPIFLAALRFWMTFFFGFAVSNIPQCPPQSCISSHKAAKVLSNSYKKLACLDRPFYSCVLSCLAFE